MIFEAIPILFLLSARGATEIPKLVCSRYKKIDILNLKKILTVILIIFTAYAFLIRFPRWIRPKDLQEYYHGFSNKFAAVTPNINKTLKSLHLEKAVVIMKFIYHPIEFFPYGWLGSGFLYNDPQLKGNIIYVQDRGKENISLFQCFPERKFLLYFGAPICLAKKDKRFIELIDDPQNFFKVYSTDYANIIEEIYKQNNFIDIDVAYLIDMGNQYKNKRNYRKAAFLFEAALQIEKHPEIRFQILNKLFSCYLKTGKKREAKIIAERFKDITKQKFYNIFPEKGF
jgi:tetratricopeptide (TPR) repeat protein